MKTVFLLFVTLSLLAGAEAFAAVGKEGRCVPAQWAPGYGETWTNMTLDQGVSNACLVLDYARCMQNVNNRATCKWVADTTVVKPETTGQCQDESGRLPGCYVEIPQGCQPLCGHDASLCDGSPVVMTRDTEAYKVGGNTNRDACMGRYHDWVAVCGNESPRMTFLERPGVCSEASSMSVSDVCDAWMRTKGCPCDKAWTTYCGVTAGEDVGYPFPDGGPMIPQFLADKLSYEKRTDPAKRPMWMNCPWYCSAKAFGQ